MAGGIKMMKFLLTFTLIQMFSSLLDTVLLKRLFNV